MIPVHAAAERNTNNATEKPLINRFKPNGYFYLHLNRFKQNSPDKLSGLFCYFSLSILFFFLFLSFFNRFHYLLRLINSFRLFISVWIKPLPNSHLHPLVIFSYRFDLARFIKIRKQSVLNSHFFIGIPAVHFQFSRKEICLKMIPGTRTFFKRTVICR